MVLALTDQFDHELSQPFSKSREAVQRLTDDYCRNYYYGIICERRGKVHFERGGPGSGHIAYDWFRQAMEAYEVMTDPATSDEERDRLRTDLLEYCSLDTQAMLEVLQQLRLRMPT